MLTLTAENGPESPAAAPAAPCAREAARARLRAAVAADTNDAAVVDKADVWCVVEGISERDQDVATLRWATGAALTPEGTWQSEYNGPGVLPLGALRPLITRGVI